MSIQSQSNERGILECFVANRKLAAVCRRPIPNFNRFAVHLSQLSAERNAIARKPLIASRRMMGGKIKAQQLVSPL
jgi:hypothetical protein